MTRWSTLLLIFLLYSCSKTNDSALKIKGSDTEVNLVVQLAERFHQTGHNNFISVSGGGSGLGITALLNNTADIANSSRGINETEISLFHNRKIEIDSFIFAQDAIAFVVHQGLGINSISVDQLKKILSGHYANWSPVTGKNVPVNIYGRQSNSGTYEFIKKKLEIEYSPHAKEMNGNAQILEAIRYDHSGIGYVGAGYVIHGGMEGIKVLAVKAPGNDKAVSPLDEKMIQEGSYFFQRPLYQYYRKEDKLKAKPFIDFEKSAEGQNIIKSAGYYPWHN